MKDKTFSVHDCGFGIWREPANVRPPFSLKEFIDRSRRRLSQAEKERERDKALQIERSQREVNEACFADTKEFYNEIRCMMMNSGWTFHQDPEIKKRYRCLSDSHHSGRRKDVHFKSSVSGRHIEVKFYEDVARENQYGGIYTHDKLKKMPYLLRLRTLIAIRQLRQFLLDNGYTETTKVYPEDGLGAIMTHRAELEDFQGKGFYAREPSPYNCKDGDDVQMNDGDIRYFWDWRGYICRGVVYRNINNMWWVHTGPYSYTNVASFHLFTWNLGMGRKRVLSAEKQAAKLARNLEEAVKTQNFERAIVLRNLTREIA